MDHSCSDKRRRRLLKSAAAAAVMGLPGCSLVDKGDIRRREIPSTSELLPVVGLGTSDVFETAPEADLTGLREVLKIFGNLGGELIDTAPSYGNAEENLGHLIGRLGLRDRLLIASKVDRNGERAGRQRMALSEDRLGGSLDLMQVHNLIDLQTQLATLRDWKAEGRIRYIGVTHYRVEAHEALERVMQEEPLDFVQFNYSIVTPAAEQRLLPMAADKGIAVIINRAFEDGRLFARTRGRQLPEWAGEFDAESWAQFFLKYVLGHPAVTCVIPGTGDPHHMVDNMSAGVGKLPVTPDLRQRMRKLVADMS